MTDFSLVVEETGKRLDIYIAEKCDDLSRSEIQRLISNQKVLLDGLQSKASNKVVKGQTIKVFPSLEVRSSHMPQEIPLEVIFDDPDVVVVNKPHGLVVHPGPGHPDTTLVNAVLSMLDQSESDFQSNRPGIVHRLDKDTSGLIIIAKNNKAHEFISEQIKSRDIKKRYIALVHGIPKASQAFIEAPIGRHPNLRKKMAIISNGKVAKTFYRILEAFDDCAFLEIDLITGRTHQVRVHLASIGHPVVSDDLYGSNMDILGRQFLHASMLEFKLPRNGDLVKLNCDLPSDLNLFLDKIKLNGKIEGMII